MFKKLQAFMASRFKSFSKSVSSCKTQIAVSVMALFSVSSYADDALQPMYDAVTVGMAGLVGFIAAVALIVIGIRLSEKGTMIAKRNIGKA